MAQRYRYVSRHAITGELIDGSVRFRAPKWSESIDSFGKFEGVVAVPEPSDDDDFDPVDRLKRATGNGENQDQAAIYVQRVSDGLNVWGGPVVARQANEKGTEVSVTALSWKYWLYTVPLTPALSGNLATGADVLYTWSADDQLVIAQDLVAAALAGPDSPDFANPAYPDSGHDRDLNVYGSEVISVGELLDRVGNRRDGFDWDVVVSGEGAPILTFTPFYPARGTHVPVEFRSGRNLAGAEEIEESVTERASRVWAVGSGTAPDIAIAADVDPDLGGGRRLRSEARRSYGSTANRTVLGGYAAAVRNRLAAGQEFVKVTTIIGVPNSPDPEEFGVGDRVSLTLRNRWHNLNLSGVRVVEREFDLSGAGKLTCTLDLTDLAEPEEDE